MNDRSQDTELRALFEAQRHDDASQAPSFAEMIARAQAEAGIAAVPATVSTLRSRWRREWAGGLAAAAAIAALIVIPRMSSGDDAFVQAVRAFQSDPALGAWQSPTDGLLNLPGDRLLSTIPSVGTEPQ
jgi:ferric-dicitrate binding protein FerR (iron transport regulator)